MNLFHLVLSFNFFFRWIFFIWYYSSIPFFNMIFFHVVCSFNFFFRWIFFIWYFLSIFFLNESFSYSTFHQLLFLIWFFFIWYFFSSLTFLSTILFIWRLFSFFFYRAFAFLLSSIFKIIFYLFSICLPISRFLTYLFFPSSLGLNSSSRPFKTRSFYNLVPVFIIFALFKLYSLLIWHFMPFSFFFKYSFFSSIF